jgi:GT2 family glycosyltransferase
VALSRSVGATAFVEVIEASPVVSIIVVTYESAATLPTLWASLRRELQEVKGGSEVLMVDNDSSDDSFAMLMGIAAEAQSQHSPAVVRAEVVRNEHNVGFGRACNLALRQARGRYVLLLNPDTVVEPGAISKAIAYVDANPDVGILGPRIRLSDGQLDSPCRRSFKTPAIYFYKLSGLSRLFPRSRRFGRYYLSYLDETVIADVDAVIGAFMLVRREVIDQIGLMDEQFFMYCEDEDWCFRAKQAGWRVVYFPESVVWHRKGASAAKRPTRMVLEWHRSIFRFHRKNMALSYPWWVNQLVYTGIAASAALSVIRSRARSHKL